MRRNDPLGVVRNLRSVGTGSKFVALREQSQIDGTRRVEATKVKSLIPGTCVVGVLPSRRGKSVTLELATPALAGSLGHPCEGAS